MNNYLPTDYKAFIHTSRYARWLDDKGRRESWGETVSRYMDNVVRRELDMDTIAIASELEQAILNLDVMPSMRAMMTAGPALDRDNTAGYNCSYLPVDDPSPSMRLCSSCCVALVLALVSRGSSFRSSLKS